MQTRIAGLAFVRGAHPKSHLGVGGAYSSAFILRAGEGIKNPEAAFKHPQNMALMDCRPYGVVLAQIVPAI